MKIIYQISENDYVQAMRLGSRYFHRLAIRLAILAIPLILLAIFGSYPMRYAAAGGLIGGIGISIIYYALLPYFTRRHYRKYKALHDTEFIAELTEKGIKFTTPNGVSLTRWEHILKWQQNDNYLLLFLSPKLYQIIPKYQATPDVISLFTHALNQHAGKLIA